MSTQEYIRSITELTRDDFPTLTPMPEPSSNNFFTNISWKTWIIIVLILALLGINIFAYLAKGTDETATIINQVFGPIFKFLGYNTLTTTKQTVQTSATGTKAGVDIVADTTTDAIDSIIQPTSGTSVGVSTPHISNVPDVPKGYASLRKGGPPQAQVKGQVATQASASKAEITAEQYQQDSLERALHDASTRYDNEPAPNESLPIGKAGWCFIGEEHGMRSCSEIGVNDKCMSGDIFPTQAVCMNPNLRA